MIVSGPAGRLLTRELEPGEKRCSRCGDGWPADGEFFRTQHGYRGRKKLAPWCRACERDYQTEKRRAPPPPAPDLVQIPLAR